MTKSTQQLADELARKCAEKLIRVGHPKYSIVLDTYIEDVQESIPLFELLEVARAANSNACRHSSDKDGTTCPTCIALTNLQKKVEL